MPALNGGFDLPGIAPGDAAGWRTRSSSAAIEWSELGPSLLVGVDDDFEGGWGNDVVAGVIPETLLAVFAQVGEPGPDEDMERGWQGNEAVIETIDDMPVDQATLGGVDDAEDLEQDWGNNAVIENIDDIVMTYAVFGTTPSPQAAEQFDQQWAGLTTTLNVEPFLSFNQTANFVKGSPDTIVAVGGDWLAHGIRAGFKIVIYLASPTNNGVRQVASVTALTITLTTSNALQNENGVLSLFQTYQDAVFDAGSAELYNSPGWALMTEDF